jgi:flagellar assembly factor FliW
LEIVTHRYGQAERVEIEASDVYELTPGLAGFAHLSRYALISEPDSPLEWLQSVEEPGLAFATVEPFLFFPDFAFELSDRDCEELGLDTPRNAMVRCLLTLSASVEEITANLLAPLVLNRATRVGRQIVLSDSEFSMRFPIVPSLQLPLSA